MQKIKIIFSLLCVCVIVVSTVETEVLAAKSICSYTNKTILSDYGFIVDSSIYTKTCSASKVVQYMYSVASGDRVIEQTTRVFICRQKNTYNDIILTHIELAPKSYRPGKNWFLPEHRAYPESLVVHCFFPKEISYRTSTPKTKNVNTTYTIGASADTKTVGVTGSVSVEKGSVVIKNQSSSVDKNFKILYDFQPGVTSLSQALNDYLFHTTEHISTCSISSSVKNYTLNFNYATNVGYVFWGTVYNGPFCNKMSGTRSITTTFN